MVVERTSRCSGVAGIRGFRSRGVGKKKINTMTKPAPKIYNQSSLWNFMRDRYMPSSLIRLPTAGLRRIHVVNASGATSSRDGTVDG